MGSNMAENHPVGFQWVMEAKRNGARVIHVDPRFTRTSAVADQYVAIRAGTDIAFLGGIVNHILTHECDFREYVVAYTNAATIVTEDFRDTEDLEGLFSGWDPEARRYDPSSWQYEGFHVSAAAGAREFGAPVGQAAHGAHGGQIEQTGAAQRDETLQHPRCVFQLLKKHFARYTPELVEQVCGTPREEFLAVARALCENSGRERTGAFCYALGWTQHTAGVQIIRTAAIIQLLLGNIGRPGGGVMALRGHASIQGSTDIPTLYDLLPGYLPMPHAEQDTDLGAYLEHYTPTVGFWANLRSYMVSTLKAWWGDAATAENDFAYGHLPRMTGDHSVYPTTFRMLDGECEGYFLMGENPVVGNAHGTLHARAMKALKWLVVRDLVEIESATCWRDDPAACGTEVFLLPAASHVEKKGTFTNTQRLLQWRRQALQPPGDCRSELWFMYHLGLRVRARLANSGLARDRAVLDLAWDYPVEGPYDDPDAAAVLREIGGVDVRADRALSGYAELQPDGSTACGCWIYSGVYADEVNQADRRKPGSEQTWVAPEWGWAWPDNRRMLYNRASADPAGVPWSERKRYVWWDAEAGRWTGEDRPDFPADKPPDYVPPKGATGPAALRGDDPFIMQADGKGWLFVPSGLVDGPFPAHYEPHESPVENLLYPRQKSNPARQRFRRPENPDNDERFPYVATTYRLTEHHTAGGMSRFLPYLSELQPAMFAEVSPALAAERGLEHAGWMTIVTARAEIEARVLVTERMTPLEVGGRRIHQVGLPWHWGHSGYSRGDSANDLIGIALDPNVHIGESKAFTCDVRPGRKGAR
jgi:formate dehydrogenase major subunit